MAYGLTKSALFVRASSQQLSDASSTGLTLTGAFTLECWIKFTSIPAGNSFIYNRSDGSGVGYYMYFNSTQGMHLGCGATTVTGTDLPVAWSPSTGVWYHVAYTLSALGVTTFYVNGVSQGGNTGYLLAGVATATVFIGSQGGGTYWDGNISLMRVWNTNLSGATISANMCNVYGTTTTNMQAEWSLNNVLTDASGNGNTLTNTNAVTFPTDTPSTCTPPIPNSNFFMFMR